MVTYIDCGPFCGICFLLFTSTAFLQVKEVWSYSMKKKPFIVVADKKQLAHLISEAGITEDMNHLDVSGVKDFSWLFKDSPFAGNISGWDVSGGEDFTGTFCRSKVTCDLNEWDVSNGKTFRKCFQDSGFTGDLSNWAIAPTAKIEDMFLGCPVVSVYERLAAQAGVDAFAAALAAATAVTATATAAAAAAPRPVLGNVWPFPVGVNSLAAPQRRRCGT